MKVHCLAGVAAVLLASTQTPYAIPITGNIGLTGALTFNTDSSATASAVTSWVSPIVTTDSGVFGSPSVFAIASGTAVSMASPWSFTTSTPITSFWSVGGFTFELLSSSIVSQGGVAGSTGYVDVQGTGLVSGNGYSATPMSWNFTSQDPQSARGPDRWTFSASGGSIGTGVPDGGATAMLLGLALTGVAIIKRKTA